MSIYTGKAIGEHEALTQRIVRILSTPLGSRVFNRTFGSNLFLLVDRPVNDAFFMDAYAATSDALNRCELLFRLKQTTLTQVGDAEFDIFMEGDSLIDGQAIQIGGMMLNLRDSQLVQIRS